jgi:hypothetical protein
MRFKLLPPEITAASPVANTVSFDKDQALLFVGIGDAACPSDITKIAT